jgi:dihydrodipicolinate synthase/N-acetylneuraminate lyase
VVTFHGAWPALVTPFDDQDQVSVAVLRRLVDYLIGKGIGGFYVCGSTGEGIYMSVAERKRVLETVVEQVNRRVPVIAHVGCVAVGDAVALARHAQEAGADGVASIIPPLYRNTSSVHDYYGKLGAAAPSLPLLAYIFGGPADAVALMAALRDIPTLAGAKYTGPNMFEFRQLIDLGAGGWTLFSGMDEECAFAAMFGASGCIGSSLNYHAGAYRAIQHAVHNGQHGHAVELQLQVNRTTATMFTFGFMGALKALMSWFDLPCGAPRLPNAALPAEKLEPLRKELTEVGFFELAAL